MTSDQRLDQLEPIMSESIAILDRHTAQLKQLLTIVMQHSDSISFLLHEVVELKTGLAEVRTEVAEVRTEVAEIRTEVAKIRTEVAEVRTEVAEVRTEVAEVRTEVADLRVQVNGMDTKLDRILDLLGSSQK